MADSDSMVEITYRSADLQPPLFLAGSFSSPPWTPLEMDHRTTADGQHVFTKAIFVKPGASVQYKFRVGSGDWWVCDEGAPTVTDDMGNRNNLLMVHVHKRTNSTAMANRPPTPPPDSPPPRSLTGISQAELQAPVRPASPKGPDASTPGFVETTMEVADSAAEVDPMTPEPELSDTEAGRLGVRRLSSTPIPEVANTAAEVADTAEALDPLSDADYRGVDIGPAFAHEDPGDDSGTRDEAPVFAYEVAGAYDRPRSMTESEFSPEPFPLPENAGGEDSFDPKDPTLERFPSNREEIIERVRALETGLNEDVAQFDGFQASPVVLPGRKSSHDLAGDFSIAAAAAATATPGSPQASRRPDAHARSGSKDSLVLDISSPSLQCIVEEAPVDEEMAQGLHGAEPAAMGAAAPEDPVSSTATDGSDASPATTPEAVGGQPRSGVPVPVRPAAIEPVQNSSWFTSFLRLLFVDWIGGFLGSVFRWRRA